MRFANAPNRELQTDFSPPISPASRFAIDSKGRLGVQASEVEDISEFPLPDRGSHVGCFVFDYFVADDDVRG